MPEGRMLSKSIATSEQVASVSLLADYLFTRMIPHLDAEGRMPGSPRTVRGIVCPLREDVTTEQVAAALRELHEVGLLVWYMAEGQPYVEFPKFKFHQRGARFDRESPSRIPAPSGQLPEYSGVGPDNSGVGPEDSGSTPVVLPLSEVKGSEGKSSEVKTPRPAAIHRTEAAPRPPRAKRPSAPWMGAMRTAWTLGELPDGAANALTAVVAAIGEVEAAKRLAKYCQTADPDFASLRTFVSKHTLYGDEPVGRLAVDPATGLPNEIGMKALGARR